MRDFCSPKPGSARTRFSSSVPLAAPRHRGGVAVQRRRSRHDLGERVRVPGGDLRRVQALAFEPLRQQPGGAEGALHRELLIEQHADEQRERIAAEQLVGIAVLRQAQGRCGHRRPPLSGRRGGTAKAGYRVPGTGAGEGGGWEGTSMGSPSGTGGSSPPRTWGRSHSTKVLPPPPCENSRAWPPCASTIWRTIASPRPV